MIVNIVGVLQTGAVPADGSEPMRPTVQPISWPIGAGGGVAITVVDPLGDPVNLSGSSLAFCVRRKTGDASPTINRASTLTAPLTGGAFFPLSPSDTQALARDILRHDAWHTGADGVPSQIVLASNFSLDEVELRPGEAPNAATPISPVTNGAVDTVNTTGTKLSLVDASQITDGFEVWVRGPAADKGPWHIEVNGNSGGLWPIDSTHITALGLTNGQWVKSGTASVALSVASRSALGAASAVGLSDGTAAVVADAGDGQLLNYVLQTDGRAADGVLRIAALGKAGHLWIAGDGATVVRTYISGKLDVKSTTDSGTTLFWGADGGADLICLPRNLNLMVTDYAGVGAAPVTTSQAWNMGNDAGALNFFGNTALPTPAQWNNMVNFGGATVPMNAQITITPVNMKTLNNPAKVTILSGASGVNLTTLKCRVVLTGVLMAAATAT